MNNTSSERINENPKIKEFVDLVHSTKGDNWLKFADLQKRPFMQFWKNMVIAKYHDEMDDFEIVFYGVTIVDLLKRDATGKFTKDDDYTVSSPKISEAHWKVLKEEKKIT